jgi:sugar lactone lactonase YvrE
VESPDRDKACFGLSGAITRISRGHQERIVTGLPSAASEDGSNAGGPHDVAVMRPGSLKVLLGLGTNPADREMMGDPFTSLGRLVQITQEHPARAFEVDWKGSIDVAGYEREHNPDGGEVDSNPYAMIADAAGTAVVADAGGNSLLKVSRDGTISTLATFPDRMVNAPAFLGMPAGSTIPMQSVPTSVAQGKHGEYYVGELTGFPFPTGGARIYLVNEARVPVQVFADGFTNIIDLAVGDDGSVYVLEIARDGLMAADGGNPTGELIRISPTGQRTVLMNDGLVAPGGLAIGPDNALYVSNYGTFAGTGEVIRIPL